MRTSLVCLSLFFIHPIFSQSNATGSEQKPGYPYKAPINISDIKTNVMVAPFAGSSDTNQVVYQLLKELGATYQVFAMDSTGTEVRTKMVFPGDIVVLAKNDTAIAEERVKAREGLWQPLGRILAKQKEQLVAQDTVHETVTLAEPQQSSSWGIRDYLRLIGIIAFILLLAALFLYALSLLRKFGLWISRSWTAWEAEQKQKAQSQILENLKKGAFVDEAGASQLDTEVTDNTALYRLSTLAGVEWQDMQWFVPITNVVFLREVNVGYRGMSVNARPLNEQNRPYYLGKTKDEIYVLCAAKCGNSIVAANGNAILPGVDFGFQVVPTKQVLAHQEALTVPGCEGELVLENQIEGDIF